MSKESSFSKATSTVQETCLLFFCKDVGLSLFFNKTMLKCRGKKRFFEMPVALKFTDKTKELLSSICFFNFFFVTQLLGTMIQKHRLEVHNGTEFG